MDIKGLPTSKRLNNASVDLNKDKEFVTVQPIGSERHAIDTIPMGFHYIQENVSIEAGSNDNNITLTSHGAKRGDIVRIQSSANGVEEFEVSVKEVVDADNFLLSGILSAELAASDEISILRPISQRMSSTGATLAAVESAPISFNQDGSVVEVTEDTGTPANNIPLPVKLMGVSGSLTLTSDELNVQLQHDGANPDSVRIGDGTETVNVNTDNELETHDPKVEAAIVALDSSGNGLATEDKQDTIITSLGTLGTAANQTTIIGHVDGIEALLTSLDGKDFATQTTLAAANASLTSIAAEDFATETTLAAILSDTASLDGKDFSTETTLAAMSAKLPASLGQAAQAASLSVSLSTEDDANLQAIADRIGATNGASETDHTATATAIQLLKGLVELSADLSNLSDIGDEANSSYTDHETQTVDDTAGGVTFTAPAGAKYMQIQNSTRADGGIRFVPAADTPTASDGFYLEIGQATPMIKAGSFKAIAVDSGADGDVTVNWFV